MKLNEHTVLTGNSVVLVPYKDYHVPKYHEWMKSEELQTLTASEPLTIEEEHCMQKSWLADSDKCTFIVLDKLIYNETKNEVEAMIGDTNIFLRKEDDLIIGEIEIMIAETSARGKGYGKEAVLLMLRYGLENLGINIYEAKIGLNNTKSISLFNKIGFNAVNKSTVFQEVTLQKEVSETWTRWLLCETRKSIAHCALFIYIIWSTERIWKNSNMLDSAQVIFKKPVLHVGYLVFLATAAVEIISVLSF